MQDRIKLRDVVAFHDDSVLATLVDQETCIQAVCTVMPNVERMTSTEKLQILEMLGLIDSQVPKQSDEKRRQEALRSKYRRKSAKRKEKTGYTYGKSRAKPPEERLKSGRKPKVNPDA